MKKILIICEYIAPVQAIASVRWTKIAKYIKRCHEVEISILTNKKNYDDKQSVVPISIEDPLLKLDLCIFDNMWIADYSKEYIYYYSIKKKFRKNKIYTFLKTDKERQRKNTYKEKTFIRNIKDDILEIWKDLVNFICYKQIMRLARKKEFDFDIIISSYGPAWTHMVAEKLKKYHPDTGWIADFRDPYARGTDGPITFQYHKSFVKRHCSKADIITRVNDKMKLFERKGQKLVTIHNGYDPEEALIPLQPEKFSLVFTGFLYEGKRDITPAFLALKELINEGLVLSEDIIFEYAGESEDVFIEQAIKGKMKERIKIYGQIARKKALKLQQKAAVLLQASWNTKLEQTEWTGKMYEYMMAKKPIVYLVTGDKPYSLPSKLMPKLGGICYEECRHKETFPMLKEYILKKYKEWKDTGNVSICREETYVKQFAYQEIAEKVWDLIEKLT